MDDEPTDDDPDAKFETFRQFAAARSNQDSKISNENSRAAAQAALLINGGAASGLLAFLSKESIGPYLLKGASWALASYAIGVALGAVVIFCMNQALRHWNDAWQEVMKKPTIDVNQTSHHAKAEPWSSRARWLFAGSILAFVAGSVILAESISVSAVWTAPSTTQTPPTAPKKGP